MNVLTLFKGRHGQKTRKHALVVTIEDTPDAGEEGNSKNLEVLDECRRTTLAHEHLTAVQGRIVELSAGIAAATHDEELRKTSKAGVGACVRATQARGDGWTVSSGDRR